MFTPRCCVYRMIVGTEHPLTFPLVSLLSTLKYEYHEFEVMLRTFFGLLSVVNGSHKESNVDSGHLLSMLEF